MGKAPHVEGFVYDEISHEACDESYDETYDEPYDESNDESNDESHDESHDEAYDEAESLVKKWSRKKGFIWKLCNGARKVISIQILLKFKVLFYWLFNRKERKNVHQTFIFYYCVFLISSEIAFFINYINKYIHQNRMGLDGKACVHRTICEVKHLLAPKGTSLAHDVFRTLFT